MQAACVKAQRDGRARKSVCRSGVKGDPCWVGDLWCCGRPRTGGAELSQRLTERDAVAIDTSERGTRTTTKSEKSIDSEKKRGAPAAQEDVGEDAEVELKREEATLGRGLSRGRYR